MLAAQSAHTGPISGPEQSAIDQGIAAGVELHRRGLLDDAERLCSGILKLAPKHFEASHLLAQICLQRGDIQGALTLVGAALASNARSADAWSTHAKALLQLRRLDEALASAERALALQPAHIQALISRATIRIEQQSFADAWGDVTLILQQDPLSIDGWTKRGNVLTAINKQTEAIESYDRALSFDPDHIEALNNRSCLLRDIDRPEEALLACRRVLELNPCHVGALINRGHMLVELHREEEGIVSYQQALALSPGQPDALFNLGINELRLGRFKSGWKNYEYRWFTRDLTHTQRNYPLPRWVGEPLDGPSLVSGEQGLGDQIMLASMLPDLAERVREITVEVEPRLVRLFARSFPGMTVVAREECGRYAGPAAAQIPMASLGCHFRLDWASFPVRDNGYLRCDQALSGQLRKRLADGPIVIGVSWISRKPRYEAPKSAQLSDFASILRLPNCRFVDLQYGDTQAEREAVRNDGIALEHLPEIDNSNDIDALASLIAACDIVVTVSNTTAHLAGALGKETYLLVPAGRGRMWCWFRDRDDSPFYPRMRLKRKEPGQPWAELAGAIAAEIGSRQGMQSC